MPSPGLQRFLDTCGPNPGALNLIKNVLADLKTQININPLITVAFNTPLSSIDWSFGQKKKKHQKQLTSDEDNIHPQNSYPNTKEHKRTFTQQHIEDFLK